MLKLIFFTTNKIKLAHARHLAESYPVAIESFRRKTFYASYTEPRINSRDDLLRESYESAVEQAENAGINTKKNFFFLEDTSVIIDALSSDTEEVPGVNVKYWMKETEFSVLNRALVESSNRKVTVRSDFLLHIPDFYRDRWGVRDRYLIFVGKQNGTVIEHELEFDTNLVFPWLDNKTFNKWFVPHGEQFPISCLPVEVAEKYDFRRHAFSEMMGFLAKNGLFNTLFEQQSLALESVSQRCTQILIICGFPCAGKTTLSQHFVRNYGYIHVEASDFMHLNFYLRHDIGSNIKISDFAEEALKQKPEIAAEKIAEYINTLGEQPVVISGFRSLDEINWLQQQFGHGERRKSFKIGFVYASQDIRFERYNKRKRDGHEIDIERFKLQDLQQVRMGLENIERHHDKIAIDNEGSLSTFFSEASIALSLSRDFPPISGIDLSVFSDFRKNIGLETPIFMALLSKWEDREDRPYFTTTQIAKLINELFPSAKPKHKDNVSRYFNQDFYAYYEIDPGPDENKRRYRLSNSGYGRAVSVYYELVKDIKLD